MVKVTLPRSIFTWCTGSYPVDSEICAWPGTHSEVSGRGQSCQGMKGNLLAQETGLNAGQRCWVMMSWVGPIKTRTGHNLPDDGISTVVSIEDGLNAVGVLCTRYQPRNVNSSCLRGLLFRRLSCLAGEHRQLGSGTQTAKVRKQQRR